MVVPHSIVSRVPRAAHALAVLLLLGAVVACAAPAASFDPNGPCPPDGRAAGAYPDLERRVPTAIDGRTAEQRDSGRNCSENNLATLRSHGITEIRFAGALWSDGAPRGVTLAVFSAPGLEAPWIAEWYEATAQVGRRTSDIQLTAQSVQGRPGFRLQVVNGDAHQVVMVWPSADGAVTQVVIASDVLTARIEQAIAAFP